MTVFSQELSDGLYKILVEGDGSSINTLIVYLGVNRAFDKVGVFVVEDVMVSWFSYSGKHSDLSINE